MVESGNMISTDEKKETKKTWLIWGDEETRELLGELELYDPNFKLKPYKEIIKDLVRFYKEHKQKAGGT